MATAADVRRRVSGRQSPRSGLSRPVECARRFIRRLFGRRLSRGSEKRGREALFQAPVKRSLQRPPPAPTSAGSADTRTRDEESPARARRVQLSCPRTSNMDVAKVRGREGCSPCEAASSLGAGGTMGVVRVFRRRRTRRASEAEGDRMPLYRAKRTAGPAAADKARSV